MSVDLLLYNSMKEAGVDLFLSVPCMMLKGLLRLIDEKGEIQHVAATREEEAVGIAAGSYLGGRTPAIIMQNSGLGNSVNAIKSLLEIYQIPVTFVLSHRGAEGEQVITQMPMGQVTAHLLACIDVKGYFIRELGAIPTIGPVIRVAQETKQPVAIILTRSLWEGAT